MIIRSVKATLFLIGAMAAATLATPLQARTTYWEQRTSLFQMLPIGSNDIVFLGNSITDGGEFAELFHDARVKNRGISGDVVSGVAERISPIVKGKPAKIFLLIGINDISHNHTPEQIAKEYEQLVKMISEATPSTQLYLQSVMPIDNDFDRFKSLKGKENDVVELNSLIVGIAEKYGATYIDLWDVLADPETGKLRRHFTNDGLHLMGAGYGAWVDRVKGYVNEPSK